MQLIKILDKYLAHVKIWQFHGKAVLNGQHAKIIEGYGEKPLVKKLLHIEFGDQKVTVVFDGVQGDQPVHKLFGAARLRCSNAPDPG